MATRPVCIQYLPVPHQAFPATSIDGMQPNRLLLRIQPEEGIGETLHQV